MKFGQEIQEKLTSEWRSEYVDYNKLKSIITRLEDGGENDVKFKIMKSMISADFLNREKERLSIEFFELQDMEIEKVNLFFNEKISYANRELADISRNCEDSDLMTRKEIKNLKDAICEFYLFIQKLKTFQELNYTAFRKINKKHDKIISSSEGAQFMADNIENARFNIRSLTLSIVRHLESLMTKLEGGDSKQAMNKLRVPPISDIVHGKTNEYLYILGVLTGSSIVFLLANVFLFYISRAEFDFGDNLDTIILLFRPTLLVAIFIIFFALNMYGWAAAGVNSVLIFEINPRDRLSAVQMGCVGFGLLLLWLVFLFTFLLLSSNILFIPFSPYVNFIPLSLDFLCVLFVLTPLKGTHLWTTQKFFWKLLIREVKAGFIPVAFVDFWFADQLNSLGQVFLDFERTICLISTDKISVNFTPDPENINNTVPLSNSTSSTTDLCSPNSIDYGFRFIFWILPAYIRFAQCIRRAIDSPKRKWHHLQNAAKYSTSFIKVAFSFILYYSAGPVSRGFWFLAYVIGSIFTLFWDLKMDWGLLHFEKKQFLRDELIYGHGETNWIYYFAILQDILFRFAWLAKYFIAQNTSGLSQVWQSLFAFIELLRRFIWNFFRLENEHLNNCGEFRAVREISLVLINESEIEALEHLMDGNKDQMPDFHRHRKTS